MSAKESITHPGIVDHVTEDSIFVMVLAKSACSSCHAKGMCNIAEMEEKLVEVKKDQNMDFSKGDGVTVSMNKSLGGKAVLLGYIVPFFLLIA
ncbi:MAG: SoxR reducing system RseC family protein, partial [Bacteroidales bacterium]|nr:SoxR reducing system RseC family protein [Bacteroidales bacterium]